MIKREEHEEKVFVRKLEAELPAFHQELKIRGSNKWIQINQRDSGNISNHKVKSWKLNFPEDLPCQLFKR